ncbi:putative quinol monooxygenase [Aeromicrobium stalagmiti]|uniref:putative quinol monooxygenase n=1 Tax=Aeromicrobium stalagmiti TaxID=2738988 RepID=UPI001567C73D|nr:putative quinol monooxygenase [Aeromicrobium stalagmiti]NRQ49476.1 antibiotic biosynthesis monooxygenase [Aeromicrobium stalagmiti]
MSEVLDVIATIQVQPGRADRVVEIVTGHLESVRAEDGCLRYDLFRVRRDPDTLVMVEQWASKDALRAHGTAPHFQQMSAELAAEVAGAPVVRVLDPVIS